VSPKRAGVPFDEATLVGTTWVHVFEEDGPEGAVYRPESDAIPRSRRPRERLSFFPDGTAQIVRGGPDDRLNAVPASWKEKDGEISVTPDSAAAGGATLEARLKKKDLLVVGRRADG
jgi:hypothetical protein